MAGPSTDSTLPNHPPALSSTPCSISRIALLVAEATAATPSIVSPERRFSSHSLHPAAAASSPRCSTARLAVVVPPPPRTTGRGTAPVDAVPAGGDPAGTWPRRPGSATAVLGRCSRNNLHALREPYSSLHALWIYGGPPPPTFHHHVLGALQQPARARAGPRRRRALRRGLTHISARVRRRLRGVHHAQPAIRRRSPHDAICGSRSHTVMCFLRWA